MSQINVNTIRNRTGGAPSLDKGAVVTGIVTATTGQFAGDVTVGGVLTYEDVTNVDSVGLVTAKSGIKVGNPVSPGIGATIDPNGNAVFAGITTVGTAITMYASSGIVSATQYFGDGSKLTGIDATAIQTGNTSVQTVDTGSDGHVKMTTEGSERVRVGPAGQIGLGGANYGNSGQLMTSGGTGAAPTWSDAPAGGNVFTGIASGTLPVNKAVKINLNGTLSEIKNTTTDYSTPILSPNDATGLGEQLNSSDIQNPGLCWNANYKFWIVTYSTSNTSWDGFARTLTPATPGASSPTVGSEQALGSGVHHKYQNAAYDLQNNQLVMHGMSVSGGHGGSGMDSLSRAAVDSSGTITPYQYAIGSVDGYGSGTNFYFTPYICYIGNGTFATMSYRGAAPGGAPYNRYATYISIWKWNGSGNNLYGSVGNENVTGTTDYSYGMRYHICAIGSSGKFCMVWTAGQSGAGEGWYRIGNYDGSSLTLGTAGKFADYNTSSFSQVTYDENAGKLVFLWNKDSDNSRFYSCVGTISGNDVSIGTEVLVDTTSGSTTVSDDKNGTIVYVPSRQKVLATYTVNDSNTYKTRFKEGTVSGTSITWGASQDFQNYHVSAFKYLHTAAADVAEGRIMSAWKWDMGTNSLFCKSIDFAEVSSNLTSSSMYYGYPDQAYTDGQTATIKTIGNNTSSLSGLTTNTSYYVQQDGTLSTTKDTVEVLAGTALSHDKLVIQKEVPSSPSGLQWVTSFTGNTTSAISSPGIEIVDLDWTNVSYYLFNINGLSFNGSSFSATQPEFQLQMDGTWITSSSYNTYSDWAPWNNSYSGNSQSAVAARPFTSQTAGDWTGDIYLSRSSGRNQNDHGSNKYIWGRAFSNNLFSNWQCRMTASQFRQGDITGIRFWNSYGYSIGQYGTIDVYKYYSGRT